MQLPAVQDWQTQLLCRFVFLLSLSVSVLWCVLSGNVAVGDLPTCPAVCSVWAHVSIGSVGMMISFSNDLFVRWVMLKNVHLAPQWLVQLEKKLHSLTPHSSFRLFLTLEITPKVSKECVDLYVQCLQYHVSVSLGSSQFAEDFSYLGIWATPWHQGQSDKNI